MTDPTCAPPRNADLAALIRDLGFVPGPTWWWLSFIDPTGTRRLGVSIVPVLPEDADDVGAAVDMAWQLGCNPGGHVGGRPMRPEDAERYLSMLTAATLHSPEAIGVVHTLMDQEDQ